MQDSTDVACWRSLGDRLSRRDKAEARPWSSTAWLGSWGSCRCSSALPGRLDARCQWERIAPLSMRTCSACGRLPQESPRVAEGKSCA
eukprot:15239461-Alexandrium_andersonii.AAC.1